MEFLCVWGVSDTARQMLERGFRPTSRRLVIGWIQVVSSADLVSVRGKGKQQTEGRARGGVQTRLGDRPRGGFVTIDDHPITSISRLCDCLGSSC